MALILPFDSLFKCPKCHNRKENSVGYVEPSSGSDDSPKVEHLSIDCNRCKFSWKSETMGIDIEQEWDDRDSFTDRCPKCNDEQVDMTFCDPASGSRASRKCSVSYDVEHLHCSCEVCSFEWISMPADGKPMEKEVPKEPPMVKDAKKEETPAT